MSKLLINLFICFCSALPADGFPSEVITHDQWIQLKSESKSKLSSWVKGALRSGKKDMLESINQNLDFVLSSAPIWDRLVTILYLMSHCIFFSKTCCSLRLVKGSFTQPWLREANMSIHLWPIRCWLVKNLVSLCLMCVKSPFNLKALLREGPMMDLCM